MHWKDVKGLDFRAQIESAFYGSGGIFLSIS